MSLSLYFLSPAQLRRGSEKAALVGTWCPARVNPPQEASKKQQGLISKGHVLGQT